jgi:antitoxin component YwqK of YwqJK toxin-antitoxin module
MKAMSNYGPSFHVTFLLSIVTLILTVTSCKNGDIKTGTKTVYFEGGKQASQIVDLKDGKKEGLCREFFKNGKLRSKAWYVNDAVRDTAYYYHDNEQLSSLQVYKNGKKEGTWKKFSRDGVMYQEVNFKNNSLDGPSNKYTYKTGRPIERLNYTNGFKEGKQEIFFENGRPKSVCYYYNYQPCLGLQEWYDSGEKVKNDFKISIKEDNKVHLKNILKIIVRLENPKPDDRVCEVSAFDSGLVITPTIFFTKAGDQFDLDFYVYPGNVVMKKLRIAAFRKTDRGNTFIKTASFNVSATNY